VSLLPFLAAAFGAGSLALLARRSVAASTAIALAGLVVAVLAAAGIQPDEQLAVGDAVLVTTDYGRLFVVLGALAAVLLVVVAAAAGRGGDLGGASLLSLGVAALVLASPDIVLAAVVATGGAVVAIGVTLDAPRTDRTVAVAARELRVLVVGGGLAIGAFAWLARSAAGPGDLVGAAGFAGLAFLAGAAAVAIRFGAIPFHLWAARVADAAPETSLPLVMAWGPAALAVVGLGWAAGMRVLGVETGLDLGLEVGLVAAVGLATLLLASVAALVHEDLEHVVGYAIIADAGIVVLAFAAPSDVVTAEARIYLLAFAASKSALAAWAAASRAAFRTRRVAELGGWARRSPPLAAALVAVLAASVAWPGLAAWESRAAIAEGVFAAPLAALVVFAGLAPVTYVGRLLAVGYGRTSAAVSAGAAAWPRVPEGELPRGVGAGRGRLAAAWRENQAPVASAAVILLAVLALAVAAGAWAAPEAARAYPAALAVTESAAPTTAPEPDPLPSASPTVAPGRPSASPSPSAVGSASAPASSETPPSGSPGATGTAGPSAGSPSPTTAPESPADPTPTLAPDEPSLQPGQTPRIRP